jgi:RimJ/RimL family protein N-acetyltransferase
MRASAPGRGVQWQCTPHGHTIESERVRSRTLVAADVDDLFRLVDPELIHREGLPVDPEELRAHVLRQYTERFRRDPYAERFAITDRESGAVMGSQYLGTSAKVPGQFVTGGWLGARWRRQAIGTESLNALLTFAREHLDAKVFIAGTENTNTPERRLYKHAGFRMVKRRPYTLPNSRVVRSVWFALGSRATFRDVYRHAKLVTDRDTGPLETFGVELDDSAPGA